jgi:mRNA-degrading endonuclease toxin of MazEF toxin-antitoxin module
MAQRSPLRGEIWFVALHSDPAGKGARPVVVVSADPRNRSERADTVLIVPLSTSVHKLAPSHVFLSAGETGLPADSAARAESVTTVRQAELREPRSGLRRLSHTRICQLAEATRIAMDCP